MIMVGWKGSSTTSRRFFEGIAFWAFIICAQPVSLVSNEQYDLEFVYDRPQNHIICLRWAGKGRQLHLEGSLKAELLGHLQFVPNWSHLFQMGKETSNLSLIGLRTT